MKTPEEIIEHCESEIKECMSVIRGHNKDTAHHKEVRLRWMQIQIQYESIINFIKS